MKQRPAMDLSMAFRSFLERCGCKVHAEGTAIITQDGEPKFDMWGVELKGRAKSELGTLEAWRTALLSLAGMSQENAAE